MRLEVDIFRANPDSEEWGINRTRRVEGTSKPPPSITINGRSIISILSLEIAQSAGKLWMMKPEPPA